MNEAKKVSQKQEETEISCNPGRRLLRPWKDSLGHCIEPPEENRKKPTLAPPSPFALVNGRTEQ